LDEACHSQVHESWIQALNYKFCVRGHEVVHDFNERALQDIPCQACCNLSTSGPSRHHTNVISS
jgi:hypothetical protein